MVIFKGRPAYHAHPERSAHVCAEALHLRPLGRLDCQVTEFLRIRSGGISIAEFLSFLHITYT